MVLVAEAMWFWLRRLCVGRLEESKIRLTQPSLAGTGAELGKNMQNSGHLCLRQQPRAAHTLRSDQ